MSKPNTLYGKIGNVLMYTGFALVGGIAIFMMASFGVGIPPSQPLLFDPRISVKIIRETYWWLIPIFGIVLIVVGAIVGSTGLKRVSHPKNGGPYDAND